MFTNIFTSSILACTENFFVLLILFNRRAAVQILRPVLPTLWLIVYRERGVRLDPLIEVVELLLDDITGL